MGVLTNRSTIIIGGIVLVLVASGLYISETNKPIFITRVGIDVLGVDISDFGFGRNPLEQTYKSVVIYFNNSGNTNVKVNSFTSSLTGWTIPQKSGTPAQNIGGKFFIELEYQQQYSNVKPLTEETQWKITFIFEPHKVILLTNDYEAVRFIT